MFEAKVYRVVVSTLGAILEEEQIAKETIRMWNIECAEEKGRLFLPVPEDESMSADLYLVVVDSYIDTSKVDKCIASGKSIIFFFSKYHDPKNSMQSEIDRIGAFKNAAREKYRCIDYNAATNLGSALVSVLDSFHI